MNSLGELPYVQYLFVVFITRSTQNMFIDLLPFLEHKLQSKKHHPTPQIFWDSVARNKGGGGEKYTGITCTSTL